MACETFWSSNFKSTFVVCLILCLTSGLAFLLYLNNPDLINNNIFVQTKAIASPGQLSNMLSIRGNLPKIVGAQNVMNISTVFQLDDDAGYEAGPELSASEKKVEERKYRHDDQYQQYMACPTSVRKKLLSDPEIRKKFVLDMPILLWDKHINASEYKRLSQFKGINGWFGIDHHDIREAVLRFKSPANRYMFDDRLVKGELLSPSDCIRCAIIGNGGIMNGSGKGTEIDAHDYVFRVNAAITKGYEKDVGTKTSFYCFTMITLHNTMALARKTGFSIPKGDENTRYLFFADSEWTFTFLAATLAGKPPPKSTGKYHRSPPAFPRKLTVDNIKVIHPDFERYLKWSWVNSTAQHRDVHRPTTGAIMMLAAIHTCDEVNIYGFGGSYSKFSEHYYDKTFSKHTFFANHDNIAENKLWELLHEHGIVNMYKRD